MIKIPQRPSAESAGAKTSSGAESQYSASEQYPDECATPSLPQPKTVEETGLEQQLIVELVAKIIFIGGKVHLPVLVSKLRLSIKILCKVLDFMIAEQLVEVAWRGTSDIDVQYQLTSVGKARTVLYLERSAYVGPAPVTLEAYRAMVLRQTWHKAGGRLARITSADLAMAFDDDFLEHSVQDLIGAAMHSGRSIFLYGPAGSGKTTLARKLGRLLQGTILVPCAVLVEQEIIQIFDPLYHLQPTPAPERAREHFSSDSRWNLCQRPLVRGGAELSEEMLDLRYDAFGGCYLAPLHLKANNGIFIADDLGRQRVSATDLLTRFSQGLDLRIDQLTLRGGHKFFVPFDVTSIFVSNMTPQSLFDESFVRRLAYKIPVDALSVNNYRKLFRKQCQSSRVVFDEEVMCHLLDELHGGNGCALLASYPRELLGRIVDYAGFAGLPPQMTMASIDRAWSSLFGPCQRGMAAGGPRMNAEPSDLFERI